MDDFRAVAVDTALGVNARSAVRAGSVWHHWCTFCISLNIDEYLSALDDPVPILQLYARRYRTGEIAPSQRQVRSGTVDDALRTIGQTHASMGAPDPRINAFGKIDFRLQRQLACYAKADPPPSRVKPIPLPILQQATNMCHLNGDAASLAIADMLILGFFFLLRPGEYASTANVDSTPFRVCDVRLFIGPRRLCVLTSPPELLLNATFVGLEFTNQKNAVRGEVIGLARSGSPLWCPVAAVIRRLLYLRPLQAPPTTPLYSYLSPTSQAWCAVTSAHLTTHLRAAAHAMGEPFGILPADISARSLRSSGAMALLCSKLDTDQIRLLGRWRSDEMLRYLHVQAYPLVSHLAATMLQHGTFHFIPAQPL
jgi:hypothetical protein